MFSGAPPHPGGRKQACWAGCAHLEIARADPRALAEPFAEDAPARRDERLARGPAPDGWIARTDSTEALRHPPARRGAHASVGPRAARRVYGRPRADPRTEPRRCVAAEARRPPGSPSHPDGPQTALVKPNESRVPRSALRRRRERRSLSSRVSNPTPVWLGPPRSIPLSRNLGPFPAKEAYGTTRPSRRSTYSGAWTSVGARGDFLFPREQRSLPMRLRTDERSAEIRSSLTGDPRARSISRSAPFMSITADLLRSCLPSCTAISASRSAGCQAALGPATIAHTMSFVSQRRSPESK
jgi:hypothetical protein